MQTNPRFRSALVAAFVSVGVLAPVIPMAAYAQAAPDPKAPVKAGAIALKRSQVPVSVTLTGQAAARDNADIRPLVDGVITKILYKAGADVKAGDPLFQIDPRTYEATLASAKASLESAEAALPAAEANYQRYQKLAGTGVTQSEVDTAKVTWLQAKAAISSAQAEVQTAQINLDRTLITSPVDGVAGIPEVSVGDLVTSGQTTVLANVVSLDPIYVDVSESSTRILDLRRRFSSGEIEQGDQLGLQLTLENGEVYSGTGTVIAVSSTVSTTTGTVTIRMQFDNPDKLILPGMFLRARVTIGTTDAFLVPQLATDTQADGKQSLWIIDGEGKAQNLKLNTIGSTDSDWIVADGLTEGQKLVVDNMASLSAGKTVSPVDVHIEKGVVVDGAPAEGSVDGQAPDSAKQGSAGSAGAASGN